LRYVNVSIPKSSLVPFTYSVPDHFQDLSSGMRVVVPLGARFRTGFVTELNIRPESELQIKPIADLIDIENPFTPVLLQLTRWMADYYLADWADLLKAALPPGMDIQPETRVRITARGEFETKLHPILSVLREKKSVKIGDLYQRLGYRDTFSELRSLEQDGYLELAPEMRKTRRGYNMVEIVGAAPSPTQKTEQKIFQYLIDQPAAVWVEDLNRQFPGASRSLGRMAKQGVIRRFWIPAATKVIWPEFPKIEALNDSQKKAVEMIWKMRGEFATFLLHGVTGSGKTEVYLRLARNVLESGNSVLILVPEIALLPLIAHRAEKALAHRMSILHSELTQRERLEEWQKAKRGEVRVVIGTRSAVFAPLHKLGLIVVDEEHDTSFKQKEYPRYHARESAIMRAKFESCPIVLGSATPSIESFYNASRKKFEYLNLPYRVQKRSMPSIALVDMKEEYKETGDFIFSRLLIEKMGETLTKGEQVLILQNRRGYAPILFCRECGSALECPHCSVSLTYHKAERRMKCHYCDYSRLPPSKCEKCNSPYLHLFGVGTERVAELLKKNFPSARIERFDRDSTGKRGSLTHLLSRFALKEIDVLVGTQMLAKGHDFPDVTLVGVVGADSAIGIPDFRSSERLYQLLTQVSGRSGRGDQPGRVIVQTFHPEHYAIRCSIEQSYPCFYEKEIRYRRLMQYPPFVALANIVFAGKENHATLEDAREFAKLLLVYKTEKMKMLGPAIAPIARLAKEFRFHILLKSTSRAELRTCLRATILKYGGKKKKHSQFSIDIDPYSIS
jgi:primosomal protein N' (replication factor Y)